MSERSGESQPLLRDGFAADRPPTPSTPDRPPTPPTPDRPPAQISMLIILIANTMISFASPMMGKAAVPYYEEILCREILGDNCHALEWRKDSELQKELSRITQSITKSMGLSQIFTLLIWPQLWSYASQQQSVEGDSFWSLNRAIILSQFGCWVTEAGKVLVAWLSSAGIISLEMLWVMPWASVILGGGFIMNSVLIDTAVAETNEKLVLFHVVHMIPVLMGSIGHLVAAVIMESYTPLVCMLLGVSCHLIAVMALTGLSHVQLTMAPNQDRSTHNSLADKYIFPYLFWDRRNPLLNSWLTVSTFTAPLLLTQLTYNPLVNSIAVFAILYIPNRYPQTTASMAVALEGLSGLVIIIPSLLTRLNDRATPAAAGCITLLVAFLGARVLAFAPTIWVFVIGMILANIGSCFVPIAKDMLSSKTPNKWRVSLFALFEIFQALGRFLAGWLLDYLMKEEIDGTMDGHVYVVVSRFCLFGLVLFAALYIIERYGWWLPTADAGSGTVDETGTSRTVTEQ